MCISCPAQSTSSGEPAVECDCLPRMATSTGEIVTTNMECGSCRANHFRNEGDCSECIQESSRPFGIEENECVCDDNRATEDNTNTTTELMCTG